MDRWRWLRFWTRASIPSCGGRSCRLRSQQYLSVIGTPIGCPTLIQVRYGEYLLLPGSVLNPPPSNELQVLGSTNWRPRMSTGLELQMFLPVINAPFRIYWAYNPLRLDSPANPPIPITPSMFPKSATPRRVAS